MPVSFRASEVAGIRIFYRDNAEFVHEGTHLLVATGCTPNTGGIGLELAGVETTDRGYEKVNERLETTAPDVWAVGDCAGSPRFACQRASGAEAAFAYPLPSADAALTSPGLRRYLAVTSP
jgi:pyruvate/2-oxoglutarate dehydrogenase complex dihydrolipoamide dehydrogenase (E3) component